MNLPPVPEVRLRIAKFACQEEAKTFARKLAEKLTKERNVPSGSSITAEKLQFDIPTGMWLAVIDAQEFRGPIIVDEFNRPVGVRLFPEYVEARRGAVAVDLKNLKYTSDLGSSLALAACR
jgi:hypothetical protein